MRYLRQSTAAVVSFGPFVDKTDAVTQKTALASQSGRLIKNGAGSALAPASWAHDANGYYLVGLAVGDTDTLGRLTVHFDDPTTFLPVWEHFSVISGVVYDWLFGTAAPSTFAGGAVASVTGAVGSVTGAVGSVAGNVGGSVASVTDRTGFALTGGEHTAIGVDVLNGLTAQGYTTGRATKLDDLDASVSSRSTFSGGAVAAVTAPVAVGSVDAVMVEAGINLRQAAAAILAGQAGTLSGAGTSTIVINGAGTTIPRITATVDAQGNRSSVTLNLPA